MKEKVLKIFEMAMEISENKEGDVYAEYLPHVNSVRVSVYTAGWATGGDPDWVMTVYLSESEKKADFVMSVLKSMLDDSGK